MCIRLYIHTYIHTYICTYTPTHKHTRTQEQQAEEAQHRGFLWAFPGVYALVSLWLQTMVPASFVSWEVPRVWLRGCGRGGGGRRR
jgi:hypothetical protein